MLLPLLLPMFLTCSTVSTPSTSISTMPVPSSVQFDSIATKNIKLKQVHVVFRHGDSERVTPNFFKHNFEKHRDERDFNPHVHSNLTKDGRLRSYELGQFLRWHYEHLLGKEYQREDVYARSTYLERASASLLLVLAGLYPPESHQKWHPTLNWQPISIESSKGENDDPLMWSIRCPRYREQRKDLELKKEFLMKIQNLVDLFVVMKNYTNPGEFDITDRETSDLYGKLLTGIDADVSIADWSPDVFSNVTEDTVRDAVFLRYETQNFNRTLIRLNGGMLLRKIVDDMIDMMYGASVPKINLYAGHEFNVVALLYALGVWKDVGPTYLSYVAIELWEINSWFYIKVVYRDGITGELETRRIKRCSHKMCPFEEFLTLRCKYMPNDLDECYEAPDEEFDCLKRLEEMERAYATFDEGVKTWVETVEDALDKADESTVTNDV